MMFSCMYYCKRALIVQVVLRCVLWQSSFSISQLVILADSFVLYMQMLVKTEDITHRHAYGNIFFKYVKNVDWVMFFEENILPFPCIASLQNR